jgi:hypothetical protein
MRVHCSCSSNEPNFYMSQKLEEVVFKRIHSTFWNDTVGRRITSCALNATLSRLLWPVFNIQSPYNPTVLAWIHWTQKYKIEKILVRIFEITSKWAGIWIEFFSQTNLSDTGVAQEFNRRKLVGLNFRQLKCENAFGRICILKSHRGPKASDELNSTTPFQIRENLRINEKAA